MLKIFLGIIEDYFPKIALFFVFFFPILGLGKKEELDWKCFESVARLRSRYIFRPISFIAALLQSEDKVRTACIEIAHKF